MSNVRTDLVTYATLCEAAVSHAKHVSGKVIKECEFEQYVSELAENSSRSAAIRELSEWCGISKILSVMPVDTSVLTEVYNQIMTKGICDYEPIESLIRNVKEENNDIYRSISLEYEADCRGGAAIYVFKKFGCDDGDTCDCSVTREIENKAVIYSYEGYNGCGGRENADESPMLSSIPKTAEEFEEQYMKELGWKQSGLHQRSEESLEWRSADWLCFIAAMIEFDKLYKFKEDHWFLTYDFSKLL